VKSKKQYSSQKQTIAIIDYYAELAFNNRNIQGLQDIGLGTLEESVTTNEVAEEIKINVEQVDIVTSALLTLNLVQAEDKGEEKQITANDPTTLSLLSTILRNRLRRIK
jgi:hypothetical protein